MGSSHSEPIHNSTPGPTSTAVTNEHKRDHQMVSDWLFGERATTHLPKHLFSKDEACCRVVNIFNQNEKCHDHSSTTTMVFSIQDSDHGTISETNRLYLSKEIMAHIFSYLSISELLMISSLSRAFRAFCSSTEFYFEILQDSYCRDDKFEALFMIGPMQLSFITKIAFLQKLKHCYRDTVKLCSSYDYTTPVSLIADIACISTNETISKLLFDEWKETLRPLNPNYPSIHTTCQLECLKKVAAIKIEHFQWYEKTSTGDSFRKLCDRYDSLVFCFDVNGGDQALSELEQLIHKVMTLSYGTKYVKGQNMNELLCVDERIFCIIGLANTGEGEKEPGLSVRKRISSSRILEFVDSIFGSNHSLCWNDLRVQYFEVRLNGSSTNSSNCESLFPLQFILSKMNVYDFTTVPNRESTFPQAKA
ncbi:hypothetical protein C9374_005970 [Naegleria lovaniensis]|uniref:F-box domain-containing protein n=1 Tax=Naegleria lovaniensis TaxID=51637 RepID=A0AA88GIH0_NAELO|nr:uncharacterized protein C9374_005970 [Naegleria lovaniensis]KAG2381586.1 hypothetical protein C9374_005970 [Naegleria lovaniensis]